MMVQISKEMIEAVYYVLLRINKAIPGNPGMAFFSVYFISIPYLSRRFRYYSPYLLLICNRWLCVLTECPVLPDGKDLKEDYESDEECINHVEDNYP